MRDFRIIRETEVSLKNNKEQLQAMQGQDMESANRPEVGNSSNLEHMLDEMLEERGLTDDGYF